jgi:hypothetical protein
MGLKYLIVRKLQNSKWMMNIIDALSHAPKLRAMRPTWAFNKNLTQCGPKLYMETLGIGFLRIFTSFNP